MTAEFTPITRAFIAQGWYVPAYVLRLTHFAKWVFFDDRRSRDAVEHFGSYWGKWKK